jgi:hypothetical protein
VPTKEAVAFVNRTCGFPFDRTPNTIAAAVTTKMLVLRVRDETAAL